MATEGSYQAAPFESWMGFCQAVTSKTSPTKFMEFCLPGTRDSRSYQTPNFAPIVSDSCIATSCLRKLPCVQRIASRWAVTQPDCRIYTQLMNGVRHLDLRVSRPRRGPDRETYFLVHTFAKSRLDDVLSDIERFVSSHPTKLIVLHVEPRYTVADKASLLDKFDGKLGKWMYPNGGDPNSPNTDTIASMLQQNKRIVGIFSRLPALLEHIHWFSSSHLITSWFRGINSVAQKQYFLQERIEDHRMQNHRPMLIQLSYTITPNGCDVFKSIFTGDSLASLADKMNRTLGFFLEERLKPDDRKMINVITCDTKDSNCFEALAKVCQDLLHQRYS